MSDRDKRPPYWWSVFNNKCPGCRQGKIFISDKPYSFKNNIKMHEYCPDCGQRTEIEVGFYYGTSYVSYAITVAISVATFVAWWVLLGFSVKDNSVFYWLGLNAFILIVLQPLLMRFSRTLWLSWFVKYHPNWKEKKAEHYERVVKEQMNNW